MFLLVAEEKIYFELDESNLSIFVILKGIRSKVLEKSKSLPHLSVLTNNGGTFLIFAYDAEESKAIESLTALNGGIV